MAKGLVSWPPAPHIKDTLPEDGYLYLRVDPDFYHQVAGQWSGPVQVMLLQTPQCEKNEVMIAIRNI